MTGFLTQVFLTRQSRIIALDGNIILIRPKLWLANEGNYHETRYFEAWSKTAFRFYGTRVK